MSSPYPSSLLLSEAVMLARPSLENARSTAYPTKVRMEFCENIDVLFSRVMGDSAILSPDGDDDAVIHKEMVKIIKEKNRIKRGLMQQHGNLISQSSFKSTSFQDRQPTRSHDSRSNTHHRHNDVGKNSDDNKITYHQADEIEEMEGMSDGSDEDRDLGDSDTDGWQKDEFDSSDIDPESDGEYVLARSLRTSDIDLESDSEYVLPRSIKPLSARIRKALDKIRSERLNEHEEKVYIPLWAKSSRLDSDDKVFSLDDKTQDFLMSGSKVMLLLGDSGGGKSTFLGELEHSLWRKYKEGDRIPLLIRLANHDKPEEELIDKHLKSYGFNKKDISQMRERCVFTLLCDGYDESKCKNNLYKSNRLNDSSSSWDAKMIITCRSTYLTQDYQHRFQPFSGSHYIPLPTNLFQEAVIVPFLTVDIKKYVTKYVAIEKTVWNASDYMTKLSEIPGLLDLSKNPFHLWMALVTLPRLDGNERGMSKVHINRSVLYDKFIETSIDHAKRRQEDSRMTLSVRQTFDALVEDIFQSRVIQFLKELATDIFKEQNGQPIIQCSSSVDKTNWKERVFGNRADWIILREASPLTKAGKNYSFLHSSLLDYFYARAIFDPDDLDDDEACRYYQNITVNNEPSGGPVLSQMSLVQQPSILQFLAERAQQNLRFKARLHKIIQDSKSPGYTSIAASNAITILVRARVRFNGEDLRSVKIQGADLSGGCFDNANFKNADLTEVIFSSAWLRQVNFKGAILSNIQFGEGRDLEENAAVLCCLYSPNGEYLVAGLDTGKIEVYDTKNWYKSSRAFTAHKKPVRSVAFSPKGRRLLSACEDATIRLWTFSSRETFLVMEGHVGAVLDAVFSPCGNIIASAGDDGSVRLWDAKTGNMNNVLRGHHGPVTCVAFSPNGCHLASGSEDAAFLWNPKAGKKTLELGDGAFTVAFSPTGDQLALGVEDGQIQVYSLSLRSTSGSITKLSRPMVLCGHFSRVTSLVFSLNGHQIVSAGKDGSVRIWNAHNSVPGIVLYSHRHNINSVACPPRGLQIAFGGEDKTVRLRTIDCSISRASSNSHRSPVSYMTYSLDGRFVASVSQDGAAKIWDSDKGTAIRTFEKQQHTTSPDSYNAPQAVTVALAPEGTYFAIAGIDRTIQVVKIKTGGGADAVILAGHTGDILCLSFSRYRMQLISGSKDKTVRIWDPKSKKLEHVLSGHNSSVTSICFSRSGINFATAAENGEVILWHALDSPIKKTMISVHSGLITSLTYSANESHLLTTSMDKSIREVDVNRGVATHTFSGFTGHSKGVISAVYFDDDKKIASAGLDNVIKVWAVKAEQCLATVAGLVGPVNTLTWRVHPNGNVFFATGCDDKSVRQWKLAEDDKDMYRAKLDWTTNCDRLVVMEVNTQGSKGLSTGNLQLLKQRELSAQRAAVQ